MRVQCALCGSTFHGKVVSDFTKRTINTICELIISCSTRFIKIYQVRVAGMDYFILFVLWEKWHCFTGKRVSWVLRGTFAIARGDQTRPYSILEGSKTLNWEKKSWKASLSDCFGRGRRILAPQSESDTATWDNACTMCSCGSTFLGKVVSDFTKGTIKIICELIIPCATHLSKM